MTTTQGIPNAVAAEIWSENADTTVAVAARIARMLVCRTHYSEFMSLFETVENGPFPIARTHIVKVWIVAHIPLCESVARVHLHKRSLVAFGEIFPIISAESLLIAHMVRSNKDILPLELVFPVFDGRAAHKRSIETLVESHVVAVNHTVSLISYECEEFAGIVVFFRHRAVFFIAALTKTLESICMIADYPFQTRFAVEQVDVRPHCVRSDADKVELLLGRLEGIAHISVPISYVTVVMEVTPIEFEV